MSVVRRPFEGALVSVVVDMGRSKKGVESEMVQKNVEAGGWICEMATFWHFFGGFAPLLSGQLEVSIWALKGDKSQQKSDLGLISSVDDVGDAKFHVEVVEVGDICSCRMAAKSG